MELTYEASPVETSAPDVVELALIGKPNAMALFQPNGLDLILDKIRSEVALHVPDISSERGRKAIASLARKVASSKVRLDDLGKELVSEAKAQISTIDSERKRMRDELDQLRDETRRPLTEWEDAEKSRVQAHEDAINEMLNIVALDTLDGINRQVQHVEEFALRDWQEFKARYGRASEHAMGALNEGTRIIRERAELARFQQQEAARQQAEREERIKAEAAAEAKAAAEARALEEATRVERAAKADRERTQREAARAEYDRIEAEAARVAAEKRHVEEIAAAERKAQADQKAAIEAERRCVAEAKRLEEEATAKREANKRHRGAINRAAVAALVSTAGITEDMAIAVITVIAHGKVPQVTISY